MRARKENKNQRKEKRPGLAAAAPLRQPPWLPWFHSLCFSRHCFPDGRRLEPGRAGPVGRRKPGLGLSESPFVARGWIFSPWDCEILSGFPTPLSCVTARCSPAGHARQGPERRCSGEGQGDNGCVFPCQAKSEGHPSSSPPSAMAKCGSPPSHCLAVALGQVRHFLFLFRLVRPFCPFPRRP